MAHDAEAASGPNLVELPLPRPEQHAKNYGIGRVFKARAYAETRLTLTMRKPTPITEEFLSIYRAACDQYLIASETNFVGYDKAALIQQIHEMEVSLNERAWLKGAPDDWRHEMMEGVVGLRRLQFFARYGDYLSIVCHKLRLSAAALQTSGSSLIASSTRWHELAPIMLKQQKERDDRHNNPTAYKKPYDYDFPELRELENAAKACGLDVNQCLFAVQAYAQRNKALHRGIDDMIAEGDFQKLALTLYDDLADVPTAVGMSMARERKMLIGIIETLIRRWFNQPLGFNEPKAWIATPELLARYKTPAQAQAEAKAKAENKKVVQQAYQANQEAAAKVAADDEAMLQQMLNYVAASLSPVDIPSVKVSPKESYEKRVEDFKRIDSLGAKAKRKLEWSMKREKQKDEVQLEVDRLNDKLSSTKGLLARYRTEKLNYLKAARGHQRERTHRIKEYVGQGWYSPPKGYTGFGPLSSPPASLASDETTSTTQSSSTVKKSNPAPPQASRVTHHRAGMPVDLFSGPATPPSTRPSTRAGPSGQGTLNLPLRPSTQSGPSGQGSRYIPPHQRPGNASHGQPEDDRCKQQ